ncbi:MAG: alpha-L-fucosidase [Spirochaetota bacterium]
MSTIPAPLPTPGDTSWFVRDRFGMFIHWGLYALGARHEWLQHREEIPGDVYRNRYFKHFDPDLYDPKVWAEAAREAGMKYFVVTTKHHEGFCLWDSAQTDYKVTNTPYGRDVLGPMVHAFRSEGLRVGFYHSLIDWHHPQYEIDPYIGPYRNASDRDAMNAGRDQSKYADYLHAQVRELLTGFGTVDVLWFDFSFPQRGPEGKGRDAWRSEELYSAVRELMPNVVLNDRLDLPEGWDVKTPEQYQPQRWFTVGGEPVVWEACQTFSGSWGYHREEASWKSPEMLVQMLADTVSKGGNLLLNVGPTGRGEFDERALNRLQAMGEWMYRHDRSIYGCTQAPSAFEAPQDCRLTYNPETNRLYLHVFAWPFKHLHLVGKAFAERVEYAQLLNDASEVPMRESSGGIETAGARPEGGNEPTLTLTLPVEKPRVLVPVIELYLK